MTRHRAHALRRSPDGPGEARRRWLRTGSGRPRAGGRRLRPGPAGAAAAARSPSPPGRARWLAAIAGVTAVGLGLGLGAGAGAQLPAAPEQSADLQELVVELRVGRLARQTVLAYIDQGVVLVPAQALFDLAEVQATAGAGGRLEAVRHPARIPIGVDPTEGRAWVGEQAVPAELVRLRWTGSELYLGAPLVEQLLDLRVVIDFSELTVTLDPADKLPIGRRVARERSRLARLGRAAAVPPDRIFEPEFVRWRGAALDWSVNLPDLADASSMSYELNLGSNVVGGAFELDHRGGGSNTRAGEWTASWVGAWPERRWLRQLRVGAVAGTGPRSRNLVGVAVTNSPFLRPAAFGQTVLRGMLEPGWEVELYRDGGLVDFVLTDERGYYEIEADVVYGSNPVELRAYGPNGEMRTLERAIRVSLDRLPAGSFEYEASAGACRTEDCASLGSVDVRYGLTRDWTVRAGADAFLRTERDDLYHPYALVSGTVRESWLVRAEAVANAFGKAELGYEPTPDLRAIVGHTVFDARVERPILTPFRQKVSTQANLFWRPMPAARSGFVTASLSRTGGHDWSLVRAVAGATTQYRNVRWSGEWRLEQFAGGTIRSTSRIAALTASTALRWRRIPVLAGLFIRGSAELNVDSGQPDRASLIVGKTLGGSARFELNTTWSRRTGGVQVVLGVSATERVVHSASRIVRGEGGDLLGSTTLEGAVLWNDAVGRVEAFPLRSTGRGGVSGVVFLDDNGNGSQDPGEEAIPEVRVRVGPSSTETDQAGRYSVWDLGPFDDAQLTIDVESLPNPLWVPQVSLASVAIMPNGFREVNLPVVRGTELVGRVTRETTAGAVGIGGMRVVLTQLATDRRFETLTFHDGEFYLMALPPGEYEITIPEDLLERLGLGFAERPLRVTVTSPVDWERPPDVDLRLHPLDARR